MQLDTEKYTRSYRIKRRWHQVVTCLAAVVVFCITYALILPAITMENQCNLSEHTHTDECYTQVTQVEKLAPVCSADTLGIHRHTGGCYDGSGNPVCGYADFVVHYHDTACRDENGALWCPLPQISTHTHGEACYFFPEIQPVHVHTEDCYTLERGALICTESTEPQHIHTEDCYSETATLVCGTAESEGHAHGDGCYDEAGSLICGLEESQGHIHGEGCYEISRELACGQSEEPAHAHTDECYQLEQVLTCEQPEVEQEPVEPVLICERREIALHEHTAACFNGSGNLVCGKAQVLAHQHTDACFGMITVPLDTQTLTCTNTEEGHVHGLRCYGTWELTCGQQEHTHTEECTPHREPEKPEEPEVTYLCGKTEHTHEESCFDETGAVTCQLEEHTHTEECTKAQEPEEPAESDEPEESEETYLCGKTEHTHGEDCYDETGALTCQLEEHTHTEECTKAQEPEEPEEPEVTYLCGKTEHTHGEDCYDETGALTCQLEEHTHTEECTKTPEPEEPEETYLCDKTEHTHEESCFDEAGALTCQLEEHTHTEECTKTQEPEEPEEPEVTYLCGKTEHTHEEICYDETGALICQLEEHTHTEECTKAQEPEEPEEPEVTYLCGKTEHTHEESCFDETGALTCQLEEHTHTEECTKTPEPEEPEEPEVTYLCGKTEHTHEESCYDETDALTCQLEEHTHTEECTKAQEPEEPEETYLCGKTEHTHGEDCYDETGALTCQLEEHTHTEECTKAQEPEEPEEPEVTYLCGKTEHTHEESCYDEAGALTCQLEEHTHTEKCLPEEPVYVCGLEEHTHGEACLDEAGELICGLEEHQHDEACLAPELTQEEQAQVEEVIALIDALPTSDEAAAALSAFEEAENMMGEEAYLSELQTQIEEAVGAFEALSEVQQLYVTNSGKLQELEWVLQKRLVYPDLTEDEARISELVVDGVEVIPQNPEDTIVSATVRNTDTIRYSFRGQTEAYSQRIFGKGRVKLEIVLPLPEEEAVFNLEEMEWLNEEGYTLTTENRLMDEEEITCQVLTGSLLLSRGEEEGAVIPGQFRGNVCVSLLEVPVEQTVAVQISAAMEHNTWDGVCDIHQAEEKLTLVTEELTVVCALTEEELQEIYDQFLAEVEELESTGRLDEETIALGEDLLERLEKDHRLGRLTDENYEELLERVEFFLSGEAFSLAEPAVGTNWMSLRGGWMYAYSNYAGRSILKSAPMFALQPLELDDATAPTQPSDVQVDNRGGTNKSEDETVSVSKTISGTDLENVFDITLQVQTSIDAAEICVEPDMAVVIVMDISNTMNSDFGGVSRYAAAMDAAEKFLDEFAANNSLGISKVGYVAFNTDAHRIFGLQPCSTQDQANALKNTMRTQTGGIIHADGYKDAHSRFTNVEAGLAMASDMLNGVSNQNKYIIFLSDGFPTTYISSGYSGYDPYDSTGRFHDHVLNKPCLYGTSYSDEAAIRARNKAAAIKGTGTTIFSIGVDVAGQTIQQYITQSENADGFSVVDRTGTTYEIGDASSTEAYKNWLRNSIGSGYYYDSTNTAGLLAAYEQIFAQIKHQVEEGSLADWVTSDPLPTVNGVAETVEFIGFYNKSSELVPGPLEGAHSEDGENNAAFISDNSSINWDLKHSGYSKVTDGNTTTYTYSLVYRVRLKNEKTSFAEGTIYPTNDTTTLQYRTVSGTDGNLTVSEPKTVAFPIPSVHGYLSELTFQKIESAGHSLAGAEFKLYHDKDRCTVCRGDGTSVTVPYQTAVSGEDGTVSFSKIPSGHQYLLQETKVPEGYLPNENVYRVVVAYDQINVIVTSADGTEQAWTDKIENLTRYELPETGGMGTAPYTAGGLAMLLGAAMVYTGKKRRKEKS